MRLPPPYLALAGLALLATTFAPPAAAQATRDQARLVLTVAPGYIFGRDLWRVQDQPLVDADAGGPMVDFVTLSRRIRPTLGVSFAGAYYPGDHVGFTGEAFLVGLGYNDGCGQRVISGSAQNQAVCDAIDGAEKAASAVALSVGAIYRIRSRQTISPYARLGVGATLSSQSALRLTGTIRPGGASSEPIDVPVYLDDSDTRVTPSMSLGVGFTAALAPGYQLRWEVRDNITGIHVVDGPTALTPAKPESSLEFRHLLGVTIGLDVVLERKRGRRY
jgi:opacity protein-like surface antigen